MRIRKNVLLKNHTNYRIGGRAKYFIEVKTKKEIKEAVLWSLKNNRPFIFVGGGTNILFSDGGFDGVVIKNSYKKIKRENNGIFVSSGCSMSDVVDSCIKNGLAGVEWAGGLPGTLGGAVFGNAGCFGSEIKNMVVAVESLILDFKKCTGKNIVRKNKDCLFGYRESIFKKNHPAEIILGVYVRTKKGDSKKLRDIADENISYRMRHQPLDYPSAGSTFKNVPVERVDKATRNEFADAIKTDPFPVIPVAAVLDRLGLKGKIIGDAQISIKHPNFLINKGKATASDILALIELAKRKARGKYGIELEEEIRIIN